jgi:threonine aldolase
LKYKKRAIRIRKALGGGMRQTGVLAAACLYGLSKAKENLTLDHDNAKRLASGLINNVSSDLIKVDLDKTETNMVKVDIVSKNLNASSFLSRLSQVDRF